APHLIEQRFLQKVVEAGHSLIAPSARLFVLRAWPRYHLHPTRQTVFSALLLRLFLLHRHYLSPPFRYCSSIRSVSCRPLLCQVPPLAKATRSSSSIVTNA